MTDRIECRLGDVATVYDGPHATPNKTLEGPWYLSISSLKRGRLDFSASAHLSEADFPRWTKRVQPRPGDTLFSYETRLGEAAHWSSNERAALGRRMGLLRPKLDMVDPRFLTMAYLGPEFQELIRIKTVHGATVERLLIAEMPNWPIALPPLDVQKRIAAVLGAFDDLIETNRALLGSIDAQQRWLFLAAWDGVERQSLGGVANIVMGQSPPGSCLNEDGNGVTFYQGVRDFGSRYPWPRVTTTEPKRMARAGDVLVAVRAPVGELNLATEPTCLGRGLAGVRGDAQATLFQALRADANLWDVHQGTGTVFSAVNKTDLANIEIPWVEDNGLEAALAVMDAAYFAINEEIADFTRTRDELLPLLMSGRVRVAEAEDVLKEVAS